ncbi:MAG: hypothetical protein ACLPY5_14385 [Candidatus Bathyarchaeia archaeon]
MSKPKEAEITQPPPPVQAPVWTLEDWKNLVEAIRPLAEEVIQYKKSEFDYKAKRVGSVSTHNRRLTYSLLVFLLGIVGLMAALTLMGKVSGDALLFLAGTVTGYVIVMVQDLTYPLFEEEQASE